MSSLALADSILNHPFLLMASSTQEDVLLEMQRMGLVFPEVTELLARKDFGESLYEVYVNRCVRAQASGHHLTHFSAVQEIILSGLLVRADILAGLSENQVQKLARTALTRAAFVRKCNGGQVYANEAWGYRIAMAAIAHRRVAIHSDDGFRVDESMLNANIQILIDPTANIIPDGILESLGAVAARFGQTK